MNTRNPEDYIFTGRADQRREEDQLWFEQAEQQEAEYHFEPPPYISDIEIEILRRKLPTDWQNPDNYRSTLIPPGAVSDCDRLVDWAD